MLKVRMVTLVKWLFLLCMGWGLLLPANAGWHALTEAVRKSEQDPRQYQAIRLDNGMTVLLVQDDKASKSLAAIALPIGSLDDPEQQPGLAHYLEHMVLMGSRRYPEEESFSRFLKQHGGSYNASTAPYRTAFYLEVEHSSLAGAVDRMADALAEPLLAKVNSDRERNAVNAEMTMARSRDGLRMAQVSAETINPQHPAAHFSGGNLETLRDKPGSVLYDTLVQFYQRYYSANLMVGVIYSNQPVEQLRKMAVESFGRISNRQAKVHTITTPAVTEKEQGLIIHYVPAQPQKTLNIEFHIANNSLAFRSKTDSYLSYLLGNRSHNTLADWLQKQGLADNISTAVDPMQLRNSGVFIISVSLTDKGVKERDQVIAAVFRYLDLLRTQGIDKHYFTEIAKVLALDFRYPSITRDMSYIEWLADMMLRVPYQHVLDSPYLADKFDPVAIKQRLQQMSVQQARIWFIGANEPHDKMAYFVNAPYSVEKIAQARVALWQKLGQRQTFSLPAPNPYLPTDFSLVTSSASSAASGQSVPKILINRNDLRLYYMPSHYFATEPKTNIELALRAPFAQQGAKQQVQISLLDYLAGLALDQLGYQASIGGVYLTTGINNGLTLSAEGFSQYLPTLLTAMLQKYRNFVPTEEQLQQAKSWYLERLDAADQVKAFELAMQPAQALSFVPYYERQARRDQVAKITLPELLAYRQQLLQHSTPELLILGNISTSGAKALAEQLKQEAGTSGQQLWHGSDVVINQQRKGVFQRKGSSTDSALAALYLPTGYDEISGRAYSTLLEQIIHPLFYNQLRSKEQLGYALFAFASNIGRQWGLGFLLQSSNRSPAYLYQRYQQFYLQLEQQLTDMSAIEFNHYKEGLINQLRERPQTLDEEMQRLSVDFSRGNSYFNQRSQLIEQISKIDQQGMLHFYQQAVLQQQGFSLLSEVIGSQSEQSGYFTPKGWEQFTDASSLQKQLPVEAVR